MKHLKCAKTTQKLFLKWIRKFFIMLTLFGILFMIGTAGSSDLELISLSETIIRAAIGLAIIIVGIIGQEASIYRG